MDPRTFTFDYSMWSHFDFNTTTGGENPDYPDRPNVDQVSGSFLRVFRRPVSPLVVFCLGAGVRLQLDRA